VGRKSGGEGAERGRARSPGRKPREGEKEKKLRAQSEKTYGRPRRPDRKVRKKSGGRGEIAGRKPAEMPSFQTMRGHGGQGGGRGETAKKGR